MRQLENHEAREGDHDADEPEPVVVHPLRRIGRDETNSEGQDEVDEQPDVRQGPENSFLLGGGTGNAELVDGDTASVHDVAFCEKV